jgi:hypothetical protein
MGAPGGRSHGAHPAMALTQPAEVDQLVAVGERCADLPSAYAEWVALLTAEALRRHGHDAAAEAVIPGAGPFWEPSWRRWAEAARAAAARRVAAAEARRRERGLVEAAYRQPDRLLREYRDASPGRRERIIRELGALVGEAMWDESPQLATVEPLGALTSIVEMEEAVELRALAQETFDHLLSASTTDHDEDDLDAG